MKGRVIIKILHSIEQSPLSNNKLENNIFISELQKKISKSIKFPKLVLDRYEGNYAICENTSTGKIIEIPRNYISKYAIDGDVLKFRHGIYQIDFKETRKQKEHIKKIFTSIK